MLRHTCFPVHGVYLPRKGVHNHDFFLHALKSPDERRKIEEDKARDRLDVMMKDPDPIKRQQGHKAHQAYMQAAKGKEKRKLGDDDRDGECGEGKRRKKIIFGSR
jgi:hypothetical protein